MDFGLRKNQGQDQDREAQNQKHLKNQKEENLKTLETRKDNL